MRAILLLALSAKLAASVQRSGQELHCVGKRAHVVHYDVEGEPNDGSSLKGVQRAIVSLTPSPTHNEKCLTAELGDHTPTGDKEFCYGANEDSTCKAAKSSIPIKDGFDCKDCFLSASADAYYKLNYSMTHLNSVEVGLRDINLRASAGVHTHLSKSGTPASGTVNLPTESKTLIDKLVGCPVCVKATIKVAFPTSIDYDLDLSGEADVEAGAALDVNLGSNIVKYDGNQAEGSKWSHEVDSPKYSVTPLLTVNAKASADLKLNMKTSVQVNVDNIVWYHLNMAPSLDTKLTFDAKSLFHNDRVCINGDPSFDMSQEANLDWDLKVWHAKDHWGPSHLYSWSKPGMINACKDIKIGDNTSVIV